MSETIAAPASPWLYQRCAFHRAKSTMDMLPRESLIEVDVDIPAAAHLVCACLPRILAQRPAIASSLADFDMRAVDRLDLYLRAMYYANWFWQSTRVSIVRLQEWLERLPLVHERLVLEARRLHTQADFTQCGQNFDQVGLRCHQDLSKILRLCCLLQQHFRQIEGYTDLQRCEVASAELLTDLASMTAGFGGDLFAVKREATLNRQRAYTLFLRNYDQVRRAVQFIRWSDGDAGEIAPPLHRIVAYRHRDSCPPASTRMPMVSMCYLAGADAQDTGS